MFRIALLMLALGAGVASAADEPPFPRPDVKEWTLDNGLSVVYLGVHDAPVVAVQVWYHVGSKDEPAGQRGAAHMFEHMMFKGTTHVPPEMHARSIAGVGGVYNAFTREDVTGYVQTLPRQHLDFAVELEAERMRNLLFRKEMVDTEREVVKEEMRMRVEKLSRRQGASRASARSPSRAPVPLDRRRGPRRISTTPGLRISRRSTTATTSRTTPC